MSRKPLTPEMEQRLSTKSESAKAATLKGWAAAGWAVPGLVNAAVGFVKSAVRHVKAGRPKPPPEEIERRRSICGACPHFKAKRCSLCKCPVDAKTSWALEKCPDDPPQWDAYSVLTGPSYCPSDDLSKNSGEVNRSGLGAEKYASAAEESASATKTTAATTDSSRPMAENSKSVRIAGPNDEGLMVSTNEPAAPVDHENFSDPDDSKETLIDLSKPPEAALPPADFSPPGAADNEVVL